MEKQEIHQAKTINGHAIVVLFLHLKNIVHNGHVVLNKLLTFIILIEIERIKVKCFPGTS